MGLNQILKGKPEMVEVNVRLAENKDIDRLSLLDRWPSKETWKRKINNGEVIVLAVDCEVVGLLRYSVLWTTVPFIGLIYIEDKFQKKGYSRKLLEFTRDYLKKCGYVALLSSSQTNEPEPQAWHKHVGFRTNGIIENIDDDDVGEIVYRMLL